MLLRRFIGRSSTSVPELDLGNVPINRLTTYQYMLRFQQQFWNSWQRDYNAQLQNRPKWKATNAHLQCRALVLITKENTPPLKWPLERIISLHPGWDGVARVATIRTATSKLKYCINKLCILPLNSNVSAEHLP